MSASLSARSTPMAGGSPAVRRPSRPPVQRLGSVKPSIPRRGSVARPTPPPTKPTPQQCTNSECGVSDVVEDEGKLICRSCGFVVQDAHITQEVSFGEMSNGAAIVQGVFVGANEEGGRSAPGTHGRLGGGLDSRQVTERHGSQQVGNIVAALHLGPVHRDRAMAVYRLAMNVNFIQGRTTREVAAACLYVACRRDTENRTMLIDFADLLEINVFKLGNVYNALVAELGLRTDGVGLYDINPENLIQRFAQDLEFGRDEHRIASEAVQIMKRMKRDWMMVGRRPAGVCGAALILAARMNNYRRTVREVVYTAKVADVTIHKRLEEFQFTESSCLSVAEFRHHGLSLEKEHDPPAFYRQFMNKDKKSKAVPGTAEEEMSDDATQRDGSTQPEESKGRKGKQKAKSSKDSERDRKAMPPPPAPIPIDPALLEVSSQRLRELEVADGDAEATDPPVAESSAAAGQKRKRGRPPGAKNKALPEKTKRAEADEREIESDIDAILNDPSEVARANELHETFVPPPELPTPDPTQTQQPVEPSSDDDDDEEPPEPFTEAADADSDVEITDAQAQDMQRRTSRRTPATRVSDSIDIADDEFDDDPEVKDCLLSPAEITVKEAVWVTENEAWLKDQQRRRIKRELREEYLRARGENANQESATGDGRRRPKKPKVVRMGDLSAWQGDDGQGGKFKSAAEATRAMMERRGYSRKINYQRIDHLYDDTKKSKSRSASGSGKGSANATREGTAAASRATSVASNVQAGSETAVSPRTLPTAQAPATVVRDGEIVASPLAGASSSAHDEVAEDDVASDPDDYFDEEGTAELPAEEGEDDDDDGAVDGDGGYSIGGGYVDERWT